MINVARSSAIRLTVAGKSLGSSLSLTIVRSSLRSPIVDVAANRWTACEVDTIDATTLASSWSERATRPRRFIPDHSVF